MIAKRIPKWYPAKAEIDGHANAIHIVYDCFTTPGWGMGETAADLDQVAFQAAADTCFEEGMALSLQWTDQSSIESFADLILDHAGAVRYQRRDTGQWTVKLIRGDYNPATLPQFNESNILSLSNFQRTGTGETVNEITVVYRDATTGQDTPVTLQNSASVRQPGIRTAELANRVAQRELLARSADLSSCQVTVNRDGESIYPGDVISISWAKEGLVGIPFRVTEVDLGTATNNQITLSVVEDVFGLPSGTYSTVTGSAWVKPTSTPADISNLQLLELPYYFLVTEQGQAYVDGLPPGSAFAMLLAGRTSGLWSAYEIHADDGGGYEFVGSAGFSPYATLETGIGHLDTLITWSTAYDADFAIPPYYAQIGDELVYVTAVDLETRQLTVERGALDTIPAAHATDTQIWLAGDEFGEDDTERLETDSVNYKLLPNASEDTLALAAATPHNIVLSGRINRPLPPGNVKINGDYFPTDVVDNLVITWAHRDRLQQTAGNILWTAGNIGPEAGTTYTVRIYNDADALIHTESGLTGTTYTYPLQQEVVDDGKINITPRIEVESNRDGYSSFYAFSQRVNRTTTATGSGFDLTGIVSTPSTDFNLTGVV